MRLYGVNFNGVDGETQSVYFQAPNKEELKQVVEDNYGMVEINWIEHIRKCDM